MAKWIYKLGENGKALREAIENENSGDSIKLMRVCYEEIKNHFQGDDVFESLINEIDEELQISEGEDELCYNDDIDTVKDFGFNSFEDMADERLYTFWNILDAYKIWCDL